MPLGIIISLILSIIFAACETVLTSLGHLKVNHIIKSKKRGSELLRLWLDNPNLVLATILIGNTIANLLASFLTALYAFKYFGKIGESVSFALLTFIILVFCEISPKTYAKHHAEKLAIVAIVLMKFFVWIFYPLTMVIMGISRGFIKMLGGRVSKQGPFITQEEIEYLIDVSDKEGAIEPEKKEMLSSIFEFGEISVKEIMVPRTDIVSINRAIPFEQMLKQIIESQYSRIPVYDNRDDDIIGILHTKDLLKYWQKGEKPADIREIMSKPYFVPESKKLDELLREFQQKNIQLAIVVDEYGVTAGLVTIEDILEEIVGEIRDEYDEEVELITNPEKGVYVVDAKINLNELEEKTGLQFPKNDYETLGGFVSDLMGKIPKRGDVTKFENYKITVQDADHRRIFKLRIQKEEEETPVDNSQET
ncbi:MAG: hypothetical protein A2W05_06870 [Candidatus Schekmanbacteria bacterium RBG_16_38_10]|uniref:Hemolysin n=1 Tax=Candidatus Schekmanbacteria bacterium RBG_16_38_10 TaxID=1817879 RepID=A0A1F7RU32_9BACT|nr:MAG: hypothetical protein A2W05_06870 [Candidatus Schekmanbacteria bacterium RBG_16_38_10]